MEVDEVRQRGSLTQSGGRTELRTDETRRPYFILIRALVLVATDQFSGPRRAIVSVCVCVSGQ